MSVATAIDTGGLAVITGGASGFGLAVAERLARNGMPVAILDVSAAELAAAEQKLGAACQAGAGAGKGVLAVRCDVSKFDECQAAQKAVAAAFPGVPLALLFNNAGIMGPAASKILEGGPEAWASIFSVNVFGAVHILKAFLPGMIAGGPLPSGKKSLVVTTSSVVGLLNHNTGPYSVSKMAATALCEQLALELEALGAAAAHVSPHSLHPTVAGTNFLTSREADGSKAMDETLKNVMLKQGISTAEDIIDGLFRGLDEGKHYIIVDHKLDVPTPQQIARRMEDQMAGRRPRRPEQLGLLLLLEDPAAFRARRRERSRL